MEEGSILELYLKVNKELIMNIKELSKPYDFSRGELPVLVRLIKDGDGISQKEIRKDIPISKSTLSKTIKNLEEKGYLKKKKSTEDRRATLIYLTEEGREIENIVKKIDRKAEEKMLKGLSKAKKKNLARTLKKLLDNLKK